jgi:hypothetical protein
MWQLAPDARASTTNRPWYLVAGEPITLGRMSASGRAKADIVLSAEDATVSKTHAVINIVTSELGQQSVTLKGGRPDHVPLPFVLCMMRHPRPRARGACPHPPPPRVLRADTSKYGSNVNGKKFLSTDPARSMKPGDFCQVSRWQASERWGGGGGGGGGGGSAGAAR